MENLGKRAKDKITGFEGVIIGLCHYLTGCSQYGLVPPAKDGKIESSQWFDVKRIEITGECVLQEEVAEATDPGGPNRDQPS